MKTSRHRPATILPAGLVGVAVDVASGATLAHVPNPVHISFEEDDEDMPLLEAENRVEEPLLRPPTAARRQNQYAGPTRCAPSPEPAQLA